MLCQSCGKNQASTHIKKIINGELTEYILCDQCAARLGYPNVFSDFGFDFNNLLGSFFEDSKPQFMNVDNKRCDFCGSSFADISASGKVGCSKCYDVFIDELMPSIKRIHGNPKHSGKIASFAGKENSLKKEIKLLEEKMRLAVKEQNFEEAAKIRDEIKKLNSKENSKNE